jgi:phosphomannomutase
MLTASHNPPAHHGLKVFGGDGGALPDADARRIESQVPATDSGPPEQSGRQRSVDLTSAYVRSLSGLLDRDRLAASRIGVVYDAMHGAGAGVLDGALEGLGCRVTRVRAEPDPHFGGGAPDPVPARLGPLVASVSKRRGRLIGLATDGDADRLAVVLAGGRILRETEIVGLLLDHLARTGRVSRGVAVSLATGSLVDRVASHHGIRLVQRPIGFKHLAAELLAGSSDVAGDESGGFAWSKMGVDKDGLLAGALLCELAASQRGGVAKRLEQLEDRFGRHACGRRALTGSPRLGRALAHLEASPPERIDGARVVAASSDDGLHLRLEDGFVMWRHSGTESVVRVYAEAAGPRRLEGRLRAAERLIGRAAGRP